VEITDLSSGAVSTIPIQGDPTKPGGGYVWNDKGQVVTIGQSDGAMTIYTPDGTKLSQTAPPRGVALVASTNGHAMLRSGLDHDDDPSDIAVSDGERWMPVAVPDGQLTNVFISPDGNQLVVTIHASGTETAYLADIPW